MTTDGIAMLMALVVVLGWSMHCLFESLRQGYVDPFPRNPVELHDFIMGWWNPDGRVHRRLAPATYWGAVGMNAAVVALLLFLAFYARALVAL